MVGLLGSEVEDIMCDQVIISTELDVFAQDSTSVSVRKLRFALTLFTKSVLLGVIGVYYTYLRNQKTIYERFRRDVIPTIAAFLANSISKSLSSVHRGITYPLSKTHRTPTESLASPTPIVNDGKPEKCVECLVLTNPEHITADVIFIHGLHGSLFKTWRQGTWRHVNHQLKKRMLDRSLSTGDIKNGVTRIPLKRSSSDVYVSCAEKISKIDPGDCDFITVDDTESDTEDTTGNYSKCWPKDWLPVDCPGARIITLNYSTDPYLWRPLWIKKRNRTSMVERSKEMIEHLLKLGVGEHPIVWVGHSKGGLFVKQLIVDCARKIAICTKARKQKQMHTKSRRTRCRRKKIHHQTWENNECEIHLQKIYKQTKAIMFYSVPHKGSILADVTLPFLKRSVELTEIRKNCPFVLNLHKKFLDLLQTSKFKPEIFSFIETSFTLMSFVYLKIVAFESADPGTGYICGVPLDHREICKPAGRDCFLYQELVKLIKNASRSNS